MAGQLLGQRGWEIRVEPVMWEHAAAQMGDTDHLNDMFVEQALRCHLVLALILTEIRPGTLEELEAALDHGGIDIALLHIPPEGEPIDPALESWLRAHQDRLLYKPVDPPVDGDAAWLELTRTVIDFLLRILACDTEEETYVERR